MPRRAKGRRLLDGDGFGREGKAGMREQRSRGSRGGRGSRGAGEEMQQKSLCNSPPASSSSPSSPASSSSPNRLLFTKKGLTTLSGQCKPNEETQMNNKSITPNPQQPVDRVPTGQLPSALAELSEAELRGGVRGQGALACGLGTTGPCLPRCSYDGDGDDE